MTVTSDPDAALVVPADYFRRITRKYRDAPDPAAVAGREEDPEERPIHEVTTILCASSLWPTLPQSREPGGYATVLGPLTMVQRLFH